MSTSRSTWALRGASVSAILGLSLMTWSFMDPRPIALMAAMTVGQALSGLSLGLFVLVVGVDLLRDRFGKPRKKAAVAKEPEDAA